VPAGVNERSRQVAPGRVGGAQGVVPDGARVLVEQGHAMGRPSRIHVQVSGEQVRIAGAGVVVAEGTLTV
jgi:predicted PhzF superfamily epimerase YddE/YHI9